MRKPLFFPLIGVLFFSLSVYAQKPGASIDVQHYSFTLQLSDENDVIKGKADVTVKFLKEVSSFNLDLAQPNKDGKGMTVSSVMEKKTPVSFEQKGDELKLAVNGNEGSKHTYTITYSGIPSDGLIISKNKFGHRTFFGDNWPNRAHNWLPCVDDPDDKASVEFNVTAPGHYQVVANGNKQSETVLPSGLKQTRWKESAPLPTKVMVIGAADFAIDRTGEVKGTPVYTYVFPENKEVGFNSYAVAREILAYYMDKVGPFAYEKLANVQSKTIFGGMENASCIFYYENSVGAKDIEELMAHEIAHQWFGDAASEKSFAHLWLSEGFATYMTNLYLENKYGADILKQRMTDDRKTALDFEKERFHPVVDTAVTDNFMQLLNANSYQKGGWVLHMLRRKLGDELFWKGIRAYYDKYENGNANTEDLRAVMEKESKVDLEQFFKQWLYTPGHLQISAKWKYDPYEKTVELQIAQVQNDLYDTTVDFLIDNEIHPVEIKGRFTTVQFNVNNAVTNIVVDPNVNLYGVFDISQQK